MTRVPAYVVCVAGLMLWGNVNLGTCQERPRRERPPETDALQVGQLAPTFVLKSIDGKESFDLRTYRDKKPVILFFGSYT